MENKIEVQFPLISVIVPVYNVENYIQQCLDSIVSQTYRNIEIIIVVDGSEDNSENICRNYLKLDDRITMIVQENQGLSAARNNGLKKAKGRYFAFVDSDDFIAENMIEALLTSIEENVSTISICGTTLVKPNGIYADPTLVKGKVKSTEIIELFFKQKQGLIHSAWGKLFSMKIKSDLQFPIGKLYEDQFVIYRIVSENVCSVTGDTTYYYRIREGSIITNKHNVNKKTLDMMESMKIVNGLVSSESNLKKALMLKIVNDSITIIKFCLVGDIYNEAYDYAISNINSANLKVLWEEGLDIFHIIQYLMIKYCTPLFKCIYIKYK